MSFVKVQPQIKGSVCLQTDGGFPGVFNDSQHLSHLATQRGFWNLGKPLGWQVVRRVTFVDVAIDFHRQPEEGVGYIGHGRDAVFERHASTEIDQARFAFDDPDAHEGSLELLELSAEEFPISG